MVDPNTISHRYPKIPLCDQGTLDQHLLVCFLHHEVPVLKQQWYFFYVRQSRKFIFWYFLNCAERYAGLMCKISLTLSSERSAI